MTVTGRGQRSTSAPKHGGRGHPARLEERQRLVEYEYLGGGPPPGESALTVTGRLLELVAVPAQAPVGIIHADRLRPKFSDYRR